MKRRTFLKSLSLLPTITYANIIDDIYIQDIVTFNNLRNKLTKIKKYVGYANFNIIDVNSAVNIANRVTSIGKFNNKELLLWEELFYEDPSKYGFYGKRTVNDFFHKINKKDIKKIKGSGHFVFKGKPLENLKRIQKDIGKSLILTSGVRGVVKQSSLYFDKIYKSDGNITVASLSLAPPGFSYHSIHDFDVGKKGFGYDNFSPRFALTKEFKLLSKLDYIDIRYSIGNKDGVRFEPWHIKV